MHACACIHVCVSAPKAINNYSGLMWCDIDPMWFANKFYGFYMAALVSIVSGCGLSIHAHYEKLTQ